MRVRPDEFMPRAARTRVLVLLILLAFSSSWLAGASHQLLSSLADPPTVSCTDGKPADGRLPTHDERSCDLCHWFQSPWIDYVAPKLIREASKALAPRLPTEVTLDASACLEASSPRAPPIGC